MEAYRIAVISDTHGVLRPQVEDILKSCEVILHAGDMDNPELLERLKAIRRTFAVRGNVDGDWAQELPRDLEVELFGFHIYMVHNKAYVREDLAGVDIVICGHSHKYDEHSYEGILFLNPGSCGRRRFQWQPTMTVLTLFPSEHRFETEKIVISDTTASAASAAQKGENPQPSDRDMHALIRRVIRDVDAGKAIAEIAARNHVDTELAEQICRMYVTHPGVDVDGILDRIERKNL